MPLIVLGALASLVYVILKVKTSHLPISPGMITIAAAGSLLDIPTFGAPHEIGGPMVFPLNGPQYTLFFEFVANFLWWALRKNAHRYLLAGTIFASAIVIYVFGLGGDTDETFLLGFPRVALSFSLGLALYHLRLSYHAKPSTNIALFTLAGLSTLALFYCPLTPPGWVELVWIIAIAPILVLSGARLALPRGLATVSLLVGEASYPIYALHYPIFCWVNGFYRSRFGVQNFLVEAPLAFAIVAVGSYAALLVYDKPIRAWLTKVLNKPRAGKLSLTSVDR